MYMLLKLAWRNVLRNKRRTFLAGIAIGIGLAALMFTDAMMIGMNRNMIASATDTFLGHGEIHRKGFRDSYEVEKTINGGADLVKKLEAEPDMKGVAPRVQSFGMITSPANVSSIIMYGVDPVKEKSVSRLANAVIKGAYLAPGEPNKVLIGSQLAKTLEVDIGDRVVITVAQAETGELSQEMFRVGGIFSFGSRDMDGQMAFVPLGSAQRMLAIGNRLHEIAFHFKDVRIANNANDPFWAKYSTNGNIAQNWMQLMPELKAVLEMSDFATAMMAAILFAVVALGILNTLFMSLYERMFEFGVLRAIGTRPVRMGLIILFEAGILGVISCTIGIALGLGLTYYFSIVGIDYTGIEYAGITFQKAIYTVFNLRQYVDFPIGLLLFTVAIGIYPAVYAARLTPAKAMRRSF